MLFEIVNPCDPLTMYAPDLLTAGIAVMLIGEGKLGVESVENPKECSPVFFGWKEWVNKLGVEDSRGWIRGNKEEISKACGSVMLGDPRKRAGLDECLGLIKTDTERKTFIKVRNERLRTSMNDIETYSHKLAKVMLIPGKI